MKELTTYELYLQKIKDNKYLAIVLVAAVIITSTVSFIESVNKFYTLTLDDQVFANLPNFRVGKKF